MIGAYEGPVLILHGDKDELVPLYYSQEALNGRQQAIEYLKEFLSKLFAG